MEKSNVQISTFTIAHYILLFMVTVVCVSIVTWLIIGRYNNIKKYSPVSYMHSKNPCVVRTREAIKQMWAYNQELVPVRYRYLAESYANTVLFKPIKGYCNNIIFTCRAGQVRRICDPCAVEHGRHQAMEQHILDSVRANCSEFIE